MRLIQVSFCSLPNVTIQLVKTGHGNAIGGKLRYGKADAGLGATVNLLNWSFLPQKKELANPQARINRQNPNDIKIDWPFTGIWRFGADNIACPEIGL
jgi:hypothetical protein